MTSIRKPPLKGNGRTSLPPSAKQRLADLAAHRANGDTPKRRSGSAAISK